MVKTAELLLLIPLDMNDIVYCALSDLLFFLLMSVVFCKINLVFLQVNRAHLVREQGFKVGFSIPMVCSGIITLVATMSV